MLGRDIGELGVQHYSVTSIFSFDLAILILTFKILSVLYLRKCKV